MAKQESLTSISIPAAGDLSAGQFRFVNVDGNGRAALVASAGGRGVGVLQDDPAAIDRPACVAVAGRAKVVAGDTVTAGDNVQSDANGAAITAASGDYILGIALTGGASGELIEVLLGSNHLLA